MGEWVIGCPDWQSFSLKIEDVVHLFGEDVDYQLNFDQHISPLCRKAGQQLNVLKSLSPFLSRLNKLTIFILLYSLISITALCSESNSKNWNNSRACIEICLR